MQYAQFLLFLLYFGHLRSRFLSHMINDMLVDNNKSNDKNYLPNENQSGCRHTGANFVIHCFLTCMTDHEKHCIQKVSFCA